MRVVHPGQHPQQRRRPGHRQGQGGEPGPHQGHADRERDGEGGVVAGERPVTRGGTRRHGQHPRQGPAGALLVDEELDRLAEPVREHGPGGGHRHPGQARGVPAAQRGPAGPDQQQAQEQQRALARRLQDCPGPRRPVRHAPVQRPVGPYRQARGDLRRLVRPQGPAGRQPDHGRCPRPGRHRRRRQPAAPPVSLDRFHGADARNATARAPRPKGGPPPRRSSGLTAAGAGARHGPRGLWRGALDREIEHPF